MRELKTFIITDDEFTDEYPGAGGLDEPTCRELAAVMARYKRPDLTLHSIEQRGWDYIVTMF